MSPIKDSSWNYKNSQTLPSTLLIPTLNLHKFHKDEVTRIEIEAKKLNDYDGFVTVTKFIQEFNSDKYDKDLIYDALTWKGLNRNETIQTVYRRLPDEEQ